MNHPKKVRVLMVCMGNICRSPTAEGVFQSLVNEAGLQEQISVDSAGTHAYHIGEPPDRRSQQTASRRGYDLSSQRARRVSEQDFEDFDYVLAMDTDNYYGLEQLCSAKHRHKLRRFLEFAPQLEVQDVPDPYYGGGNGFEGVLDLVEAASKGLLEEIRRQGG